MLLNYGFEVLESLADLVPGLRGFGGVKHVVELVENWGR